MTDQNSQTPEGDSQDGSDLIGRVNGLMSLSNRRLSERDAAIAERDAAQAELAELRAQLDSEPERPEIPHNPAKVRRTQEDSDTEALKNLTWDDI